MRVKKEQERKKEKNKSDEKREKHERRIKNACFQIGICKQPSTKDKVLSNDAKKLLTRWQVYQFVIISKVKWKSECQVHKDFACT